MTRYDCRAYKSEKEFLRRKPCACLSTANKERAKLFAYENLQQDRYVSIENVDAGEMRSYDPAIEKNRTILIP